jgi:hypothetical protein
MSDIQNFACPLLQRPAHYKLGFSVYSPGLYLYPLYVTVDLVISSPDLSDFLNCYVNKCFVTPHLFLALSVV